MDEALLVKNLALSLKAECIETHISWIVLTDSLAYKFKKPVRLPFVDYSTLARRLHCCEEELRLNRRLAPTLYLGVSRVTGSPEAPVLDGAGPLIECAVRMKRFAPGALFSERVIAGTLEPQAVDQLGALLAAFYRASPRCAPSGGAAATSDRLQRALSALDGARAACSATEYTQLREGLTAEAAQLRPLWAARQAQGHVREGHGDLHLANLVCLDEGVAAFDGIEFDADLRCIDVIEDLAFAVMDFAAHQRRDFAYRLLNAWLDRTGDHAAVPALRFAVVYRALVRAQVALLSDKGATDAAVAKPGRPGARQYVETALTWLRRSAVELFVTHGLPGSGKTHVSQRVLEAHAAVRLRSDVERKRLYGLDMLADSRAAGVDLYQAGATARTYAHLIDTARMLLRAGFSVVLDAAFLRRTERAQALALAQELGVPLTILVCEAPLATLQQRLLARRGDASEADVAVLERLQPHCEALGEDERAQAQVIACGP